MRVKQLKISHKIGSCLVEENFTLSAGPLNTIGTCAKLQCLTRTILVKKVTTIIYLLQPADTAIADASSMLQLLQAYK